MPLVRRRRVALDPGDASPRRAAATAGDSIWTSRSAGTEAPGERRARRATPSSKRPTRVDAGVRRTRRPLGTSGPTPAPRPRVGRRCSWAWRNGTPSATSSSAMSMATRNSSSAAAAAATDVVKRHRSVGARQRVAGPRAPGESSRRAAPCPLGDRGCTRAEALQHHEETR